MLIRLICHRKLFGEAYWTLQPELMRNMPQRSGLFACPLVPTSEVFSEAKRPGDIDLLVIPYEENEILLDQSMAIEVKATRAEFYKQGKSPNASGYSQARGLLSLGIPYVAVAHLIISDSSPQVAWKPMLALKVIDTHGRATVVGPVAVDPMPANLIQRSYGRLAKSRPCAEIGFVAAYLGDLDGTGREKDGLWYPMGEPALINPQASTDAAQCIGDFFERNARRFLDNPMWSDESPLA